MLGLKVAQGRAKETVVSRPAPQGKLGRRVDAARAAWASPSEVEHLEVLERGARVGVPRALSSLRLSFMMIVRHGREGKLASPRSPQYFEYHDEC